MNYKVSDIINKVKSSRILVIGDLILDCMIKGDVSGLSAEAPIVTFKEKSRVRTLGGAANVALNLKYADQNVSLCSIVGADSNGKLALELLDKESIDRTLVVTDEQRKTTMKKRYYTEQNSQLFRSDNEDQFDMSFEIETYLLSRLDECINKYDIIVLSDYSKGVLTRSFIARIVEIAHTHDIKVVVDPKDSDYSKYINCDILKPNKKELTMMLKCSNLTYDDILHGCESICSINNHEMMIVTLGAEGMFFYCKNGKHFKINSLSTSVVDVTGAGDTVAAYIALAIASNIPIEETLFLASAAASCKLKKTGASPVGIGELFDSKIIDVQFLSMLSKALLGKRVVFTNGCFDLLHIGHISCLQQAKAMGDVLVVGINSDTSVKRLKGQDRPIVTLDNRMKMLEALSCVDYIVPFDDDTPINLIEKLIPTVLVKGADYKGKEVVGESLVVAHGGTVHLVELVQGASTSLIVESIKTEHE